MTRKEIKKRAETFFEWPTDDHRDVTLTSCIFFAEWCVKNSKKSPQPEGEAGQSCRGENRQE